MYFSILLHAGCTVVMHAMIKGGRNSLLQGLKNLNRNKQKDFASWHIFVFMGNPVGYRSVNNDYENTA